jgi:fido (protein-threonine AMPylation protein)
MLDDPYIDPRTGILRNRAGLATQKGLDGFEAEQTWLRLSELAANPLPGDFDAAHFRAIHQFIFQDVYDWAANCAAAIGSPIRRAPNREKNSTPRVLHAGLVS